MTEETFVTITENPVKVSITDNTPTVTVTDLNTETVTVIDASPQVSVYADQQPQVVVNTGVGGKYDTSTLLGMLTGQLNKDQFEYGLKTLFTIHETDPLLFTSEIITQIDERLATSALTIDVDSLTFRLDSLETSVDSTFTEHWSEITATKEEITFQVGEVQTSVDGQITNLESSFNIRASSIELSVSQLETDVDGRITDTSTLISQSAADINLLATRVTDTEDALSSHESSININADNIALRVTEIADLDSRTITNESNIAMYSDSLALTVTKTDSLTGRMDTAESNISATDGVVSSFSTEIASHNYRISATETLLQNQWGIEIEEDIAGNEYVSGVRLIQHNNWAFDIIYEIGDTVYDDGEVYECNVNHTATDANRPPSTSWTHLPEGYKSQFVIQADIFQIKTDSGSQQVFSVTEDNITLNSNVHVTGTLTIGPGSTGYDEITDAPTSISDINVDEYVTLIEAADKTVFWFYDYNPSLSNEPYTLWADDTERDDHIDDVFYNTTTNKPYRFQADGTSYQWVELTDPDIQTALENASDAADLADSKRRVFTTTPTPPYDVGDQWANGDTIKVCNTAKADGDSYSSGDWDVFADTTATNIAYDTSYVNGVIASLVEHDAAIGASFTSVDAGSIAYLNRIEETNISDGAITTPKLQAGQVTAAKMAAGTITAASGIIGLLAVETAVIGNQAVSSQVSIDDNSTQDLTLQFWLNVDADLFVTFTVASSKNAIINLSIDNGPLNPIVDVYSGAVTTIGATLAFNTTGAHYIRVTQSGPDALPGYMCIVGLIARK